MADDSGERTEDPTGKKLSEARKKGQIARSRELGTAMVLIMSAVAVIVFGRSLAVAMLGVMENGLKLDRADTFDSDKAASRVAGLVELIVEPLAAIFIVIFISAFIGNSLMGGFNWSSEAMAPKFSKLSPLQGFKRMFGVQALVELLKSILKVTVVFTFSYFFLQGFFTDILHLSIQNLPGNIFSSLDLLAWIFLGLTSSMLLIAAVDAPYQKWSHKKQLKMTKQEVKDEYKNSEGSPEVKGRIRRLQREAAQRRMMQEVPDADVVVTNPTHFSVAIKYDTSRAGAPLLVAKGADEIAMHIRKVAKENDVPVIASPALARTIYYTTEIEEEIPEKLFVAVAQVLAYVLQLKQFKAGKGRKPTPLSKKLPIPPELRH